VGEKVSRTQEFHIKTPTKSSNTREEKGTSRKGGGLRGQEKILKDPKHIRVKKKNRIGRGGRKKKIGSLPRGEESGGTGWKKSKEEGIKMGEK